MVGPGEAGQPCRVPRSNTQGPDTGFEQSHGALSVRIRQTWTIEHIQVASQGLRNPQESMPWVSGWAMRLAVSGSGRDAQTGPLGWAQEAGYSGCMSWVLVSPFPFPIHIPPSQLPVSVLGPQELPLLITVQNGLLVSVGGPVCVCGGGESSQPKGHPQREEQGDSVPLGGGGAH